LESLTFPFFHKFVTRNKNEPEDSGLARADSRESDKRSERKSGCATKGAVGEGIADTCRPIHGVRRVSV